MVITGIIIMYTYYFTRASISYMHSHDIKSFLLNTELLFLIIVPNILLPREFYPENIDLTDTDDHGR